MRILLSGYSGFMGQAVCRLAAAGVRAASVVAGVDPKADGSEAIPVCRDFADAPTDVDCLIDFSHHSATEALLAFAVANRIPAVIATTGQTDEERAAIRAASEKIPLFFSANYSLGIALLIELAKKVAVTMPGAEIEIVETHHDRKLDAPSGTALAIADAICSVRPKATKVLGRCGYGKRLPEEIGIHALRLGNVVGKHEVTLATPNETLTLKHEAHDRSLFAEGALAAAEFLGALPKDAVGFYDMRSVVKFT